MGTKFFQISIGSRLNPDVYTVAYMNGQKFNFGNDGSPYTPSNLSDYIELYSHYVVNENSIDIQIRYIQNTSISGDITMNMSGYAVGSDGAEETITDYETYLPGTASAGAIQTINYYFSHIQSEIDGYELTLVFSASGYTGFEEMAEM